jgi:hypothetical protein
MGERAVAMGAAHTDVIERIAAVVVLARHAMAAGRVVFASWVSGVYLLAKTSSNTPTQRELSQRLVGFFRHGSQYRGVFVQKCPEPTTQLPQSCAVALGIGFSA